jgi:archaellum component FlaC
VENSMGLAQSFEEISKGLKAMSTRLERIEKSVLPKR